jgi:hypothetical protein
MYYVGLDVHYRTSTYCILDNNGLLIDVPRDER